ncbi:MAG: addiction module toxin RelE, partial [Gammaproteobacteria bacterium]
MARPLGLEFAGALYHATARGNRNLGRGMRRLNGVYTQAFNRRHGLVGHVLQGRYQAIVVDRDAY